MSIIADALKKVEGNSSDASSPGSAVPPATPAAAPAVASPSVPPAAPYAPVPVTRVKSDRWVVLLTLITMTVLLVLLVGFGVIAWYHMRNSGPVPVASDAVNPAAAPVTPEVVTIPLQPVAVAPVAPETDVAEEGGEPPPAVAAQPAPKTVPLPAAAPVPEPVAQPIEEEEPLQLSGIVVAGPQRLARINGDFVAEGEDINGYTVLKIGRDAVGLMKDGEGVVLRVKR